MDNAGPMHSSEALGDLAKYTERFDFVNARSSPQQLRKSLSIKQFHTKQLNTSLRVYSCPLLLVFKQVVNPTDIRVSDVPREAHFFVEHRGEAVI
jgi:hypothetical protein